MDKFNKQPAEVVDVDFDFTEWLAARDGVTPSAHSVTADAGITVVSDTRTDGVVKVVLGGGAHGEQYKVTVLLTAGVLVREAECLMRVKEL